MIFLKTSKEIKVIKEGGKKLAEVMEKVKKAIRPGIAAIELERLAESLILESGGKCSFKGYESTPGDIFPACLCLSFNEEIVHGIPAERILQEGDIVSLDLGFFYKGFHSDMAETVAIGKPSPLAKKLIDVTREALHLGTKELIPGHYFGDVGFIIQSHAEKHGFGVVRDLCGHGIGKNVHEDPQVLNYGRRRTGIKIVEGMVVCLEPMFTVGSYQVVKDRHGSSYRTSDRSLSAHFEHTVAVTKKGPLVLTKK
ncbi:MAG: type I methionyl aminopeptidase [bacterium]